MLKTKKILDKKLQTYFKNFSLKRVDILNDLFSSKISLQDWTINLKGKKKVLNFNKKLFKKFKKINVKILQKFYDLKNKIVVCNISITLNKKKINVIDIIYFDKKYKINKIRAYLG